MPQVSTIETLPPAIRSEIDRLLIQRVSLDDILHHLQKLSGQTGEAIDVSRSALGRYALHGKRLRERLTRSREMAIAVAKDLGEAPGSQQMTVLIELLQTHLFDLMLPVDDAAELDSEQVAQIAKGLKDITTAARGNIEFMKAAEARAAEAARSAAATAAETIGRERGISADTMEAIKRGIFGVKAG